MKLVVGLGNPGPKYETTRHNAGFLAVDRLVDRWSATGPQLKSEAEVYQARLGDQMIWLMKPQTFMNLSGKSVGPVFKFYQLKPDDLLVIHDDLDLPLHSIRIKSGGGAGGHNGIKSIDDALGRDNQGYHRLRIGIGRPGGSAGSGAGTGGDAGPQTKDERQGHSSKIPVHDFVLSSYSNAELSQLDQVLDDVASAAEMILRGESLKAMNKFHKKTNKE